MKQNQKGFTLIELLVVVAIIGLLASVVVVSLNGARAKARDAKRVADMKSMQNALELYFSDNGVYPSVDTTAATLTTNKWTTGFPSTATGQLTSSYIPSLPVPPSVDNATDCSTKTYRYAVASPATDYGLQFCLNGATGTFSKGLNYITGSGGSTTTAPSFMTTP